MKHIRWLFFLILMILSLSACHSPESDDVTFYYSRDPAQYQYFQQDSVICEETRDLLGHRYDLQYMAGLYLAGPMGEGLIAPFTKNTRLISIHKEGNSVLVELSDHTNTLTDSEFILSCACLAMTCMSYIQCDDVTVTSGERSVTMDRDILVLTDIPLQLETNGG